MTFKRGDSAYTLKGEWVEVIKVYRVSEVRVARYLVAPNGGTLTSWHEIELFNGEELVASCVKQIIGFNADIDRCEVELSHLDSNRKYVLDHYIPQIAEQFALIDGFDNKITDLEDTLKRVGFDVEKIVFVTPPPLFVTTDA